MEWRRCGELPYPRESLFALLGLSQGTGAGSYPVGKGTLVFDGSSPAALSYRPDGSVRVRELVRTACTAAKLEYRETDHMVLRRGPYLIGVGLEGTPSGAAHELQGHFIDLFAPRNPIAKSFKLAPGQVGLLYDVDRVGETFPRVLASACKTLEPGRTRDGGFGFQARGPEQTESLAYIGLKAAPRHVSLDGQSLARESWVWDDSTHVLRVRFPNQAAGRKIVIE